MSASTLRFRAMLWRLHYPSLILLDTYNFHGLTKQIDAVASMKPAYHDWPVGDISSSPMTGCLGFTARAGALGTPEQRHSS